MSDEPLWNARRVEVGVDPAAASSDARLVGPGDGPPPSGAWGSEARLAVADFVVVTAASIHQRLGDVAGVVVSAADRAGRVTSGSSTALAARLSRVQVTTGPGPRLAALERGETVYVPDLASDDRWGAYGPKVAALGAASSISVPVVAHDGATAVFEVYAGRTDGFDEDQRRAAAVVAHELVSSYTLALDVGRQAVDLDDLHAAIERRRHLDLALGILMQRAQVSEATATALLRTQSQQRDVPLLTAAAQVIASIPGTTGQDTTARFRSRAPLPPPRRAQPADVDDRLRSEGP
ncbi:GAF and ANTAR domain-containing protein [Nocardioides dongxiaopingii]|nr:GAF and ANTAR domain-containing protein [Nocardioides sp. S-1144]